jgi:hypothetical protein
MTIGFFLYYSQGGSEKWSQDGTKTETRRRLDEGRPREGEAAAAATTTAAAAAAATNVAAASGSPAILTDEIPERDLSDVADERVSKRERWDFLKNTYRYLVVFRIRSTLD